MSGKALAYLDPLNYLMDIEERLPVMDYRGFEKGQLAIKVTPQALGYDDEEVRSPHAVSLACVAPACMVPCVCVHVRVRGRGRVCTCLLTCLLTHSRACAARHGRP